MLDKLTNRQGSAAGLLTWEAGCASPYHGTWMLSASPHAACGASSTSCSAVDADGGAPMPADELMSL